MNKESISERPETPGPPHEGHGALTHDRVQWLVLKNTLVQTGARTVTALSKYAGYIMIVRFFGAERFGEFSLILTLLALAETVLDFGYGDIMTRELCQHPARRLRLLTVLNTTKIIQIVVVYALLAGLLLALGYPGQIVQATLVAGIELVFFGGILVYRTIFKTDLKMERDAFADVVGTFVFLILLAVLCHRRAGLVWIYAAFVAGRMIYFAVLHFFGRREFNVLTTPCDTREVGSRFVTALPFGLCLFTAVLFNSQDMVMLSKMDTLRSVGLYSVAYRFVYPIIAIAVALMSALFPILSAYWGRSMDKLAALYQQGINTTIILAGAVFCGIEPSARFLTGLWGPEAVEATLALQILGAAIVVLYISSTVGPMFIVIGRRWLALAFGCFGVLLNFTLNLILIPRYSYIGAAVATILTEICLMCPAFYVVQRAIGYRLQWWIVGKVLLCCGFALALVYQSGLWGTFWAGALSVILYGIAALATKTLRPAQLQAFLQGMRSREQELG
jgi:O-antigen/teichoic acid export membrane protein